MEEAEKLLDQTLQGARSRGNLRHEAATLGVLGVLYMQTGRDAEAEQSYVQSIARAREVGDLRLEANSQGNLSALWGSRGRLAEAEELLWKSINAIREVGDRGSEAVRLANLASVLTHSERFAEAEQVVADALSLARETGSVRTEGNLRSSIAMIERTRGNLQAALENYRASFDCYRRSGEAFFAATVQCEIAVTLLRVGRREDAIAPWNEGMTALAGFGDDENLDSYRKAMQEACEALGYTPLPEPLT